MPAHAMTSDGSSAQARANAGMRARRMVLGGAAGFAALSGMLATLASVVVPSGSALIRDGLPPVLRVGDQGSVVHRAAADGLDRSFRPGTVRIAPPGDVDADADAATLARVFRPLGRDEVSRRQRSDSADQSNRYGDVILDVSPWAAGLHQEAAEAQQRDAERVVDDRGTVTSGGVPLPMARSPRYVHAVAPSVPEASRLARRGCHDELKPMTEADLLACPWAGLAQYARRKAERTNEARPRAHDPFAPFKAAPAQRGHRISQAYRIIGPL